MSKDGEINVLQKNQKFEPIQSKNKIKKTDESLGPI